MKRFLLKSIPVYFVLIVMTSMTAIAIWYARQNRQVDMANAEIDAQISANCPVEIKRMQGLKYIKPLMFVDAPCESDALLPVKAKLVAVIEALKSTGKIDEASFYIRTYNDENTTRWISHNDHMKFSPGSLLKVPELIALLKMNELHPGFLDKKITFSHLFASDKNPVFLSKSIKLGQSYTVRELLKYMIVYSDNNATQLLNTVLDVQLFKKVFRDFGMEAPDWSKNDYPISARDFSYFMRALYNASYLSIEDSEYATSLLAQTEFNKGMLSALPTGVRLAHKFGEAGNDAQKQLHESALVYGKKQTYLLTIMTKGKSFDDLPQAIKAITEVAEENLDL